MARMYPAHFDTSTNSSAERRLYDAFSRELDDEWVVLHHVKWIGNDEFGHPRDGEADFVVAHPYLGVLVFEIKGGRVRFEETTGHFISKDRYDIEYDIGDPFEQAMKSKKTLLEKMRGVSGWPGRRVNFGHAVALSDTVVQTGWLRPNAPREIIIDALDLASLEGQLRTALTFWSGQATPAFPHYVPPGRAGIDALVHALAQSETIRNPLLAESSRDDEQNIVRLTQRQFHFLRFLKGQRRAAVAGCAGSGKTLLAIEKARQLAEEGLEKILFTCYNRALAQYLGETLGYQNQFEVFSFHQLCVYWANQAGQAITSREEASPDYFNETLPNALMEAIDTLGSQYDAIIVDEGQDFRQEWWEVLPWLLHDPADSILYVFFDDNQRLYRDRSPIPVVGEPYQLIENCRNTQRIFSVVGRFYSGVQTPVALGPEGQSIEVIPYTDAADGKTQLHGLLQRLLDEEGFTHSEIAVLTARGFQTSDVLGQRLGTIQLTGRLPLAPGEVLATTVRRFKGLERSVIVLCEVDSRIPPGDAESLMYVGTSRAKTYLVVLLGLDAPGIVRSALTAYIPTF
ncbi:MAG: NERD domain-containing protein [Ktedonobacteraceae bacterium]